MNRNSTPLLRGNAPIPKPISPPCDSPNHWSHHNNRVDYGPSQLSSRDYVRTSIHTLRRSGEHRDILLYEEFDDRFPHHLLLVLGPRSTTHNSSGHGPSGYTSSRRVSSFCMVAPFPCPCLNGSWGGKRWWRGWVCWVVVHNHLEGDWQD